MAKYKILVIAHALKNNQVAKYGEVVDESQLTAPSIDLISQGFISLCDDKDTKESESGDSTEGKLSAKEEIKKRLKQEKK